MWAAHSVRRLHGSVGTVYFAPFHKVLCMQTSVQSVGPLLTAAHACPCVLLLPKPSAFHTRQGLGENELRQIFEPFGPLDSVSVVRDAAGNPMSIAYVVFRNGFDGSNAMTHWHGQSLLDNVLTVTATALDAGMGGPGPAVGVGELDDEDGGLKIDAQKRAALMSRLASSAGITQPAAAAIPGAAPFTMPALASHPGAAAGLGIMPGGLLAPGAGLPGVLGAAAVAAGVPGVMGAAAAVPGMLNPGSDLSLQQGLLGPASPIPTQCLLLKNMFDASQQTEPEWVAEVTEDVREECSKFGAVLHVYVDKASQVGVWLWCIWGLLGVVGGGARRTDKGNSRSGHTLMDFVRGACSRFDELLL